MSKNDALPIKNYQLSHPFRRYHSFTSQIFLRTVVSSWVKEGTSYFKMMDVCPSRSQPWLCVRVCKCITTTSMRTCTTTIRLRSRAFVDGCVCLREGPTKSVDKVHHFPSCFLLFLFYFHETRCNILYDAGKHVNIFYEI